MEDALSRGMPLRRSGAESDEQPRASATARFGGGGSEPVLVAVIEGPMQIGMAREALAEAEIPAYIKQESVGPIYGLSIGEFGTAEVWTPPALAEQARDILIGIGLLGDEE